ncbi:UNVERIFIED_CONTAM: hypothetical protein Sindi_1005100 [Sesamum indicum]
METKLLEAACSGNLQALYDVVQEAGAAVLLKLHLSGSVETPLHLAFMFGQANFVREYMKLSSISAHQLSQLNQDGCSPLHLASAAGHLEMVTFLLEFGKQKSVVEELCMNKDRDGRTALHSAVVNGKIDVIDVLFDHCPQAATKMTFHKDSILHLAVKHHQHEALMFLIDQKFGSSVEDLLNLGDWEGNTILHLATNNRQLQTVEYLVKQPNLNVNAENSNGLRPLDMLLVNTSNEAHIEETITLAGGCRSQMATTNVQARLQHPHSLDTSSTSISQADDTKRLKQLRSGIIVMASIFATMTFQVVLTPPGGVWQDWGPNAAATSNTSAIPAHKPGESILYDLDQKKFRILLSCNTQAFLASIATIIIMLQVFKAESPAWKMGIFCVSITVVFVVVEYFEIVRLIVGTKLLMYPGFIAPLIIWALILGAAILSLNHKSILQFPRRDFNTSSSSGEAIPNATSGRNSPSANSHPF